MRITQEDDYALRTVFYLCKCGQGQRVEAKTISEKENIPPRFLLKLLRKLTVANILKSYMGYGGGYAIEKPPREITLRNVIEAIEGPIYVNKCLEDDAYCNAGRSPDCVIHRALQNVQENFLKELEKINFEKLLNDAELAESLRENNFKC